MKCSVMGVICSRIWGVETSQKKLSFRLMAFPCAHISCLKFLLKISFCNSQDYRWYFSIQEKLNTLGTPAPKTYNKLMALVTTKKTKIEYLHHVSLFFFPNNFSIPSEHPNAILIYFFALGSKSVSYKNRIHHFKLLQRCCWLYICQRRKKFTKLRI